MRHLSVPSDQTQAWLERCRAEGWLESTGVVALDATHRGVPLNEHAPGEGDACWNGLNIVEVQPLTKGPTHWKERLPEPLKDLPDSLWPTAYEVQGDVLTVKLEGAAREHGQAVANAMLDQLPSVRIVCADEGVKGDFRVRDLVPLAWRGDEPHTRTEIREHGHRLLVDPSQVYFSSRLSTQRLETVQQLHTFADTLSRPLVVADPYAGVGPALPGLLALEDVVAGYLVGDLNPAAVALLEENLRRWTTKQNRSFSPATVVCKDARTWKDDERLCGQAHALLVNLPHDSFEHLPDLFPLFDRSTTSLLRGWAIVERSSLDGRIDRLNRLVGDAGGTASGTHVAEIKGFSTTRCFVVFQTTITWD